MAEALCQAVWGMPGERHGLAWRASRVQSTRESKGPRGVAAPYSPPPGSGLLPGICDMNGDLRGSCLGEGGSET